MVILVDLDDDTSDPAIRSREDFDDLNIKDDNSTVSGRVVAALGCYPYARGLPALQVLAEFNKDRPRNRS